MNEEQIEQLKNAMREALLVEHANNGDEKPLSNAVERIVSIAKAVGSEVQREHGAYV